MNMFAKNDANTIEEYLSNIPFENKEEIDFIHDFIQKSVPNLTPYYATNMIGYGTFHYLDSKKQRKAWPIISLACQKNYVSIYVCAMIEDKSLIEKYKLDLGKMTKSLGCIRFKKIDEIKLESLKEVLLLAEKQPGVAGARLVD